MAKRRCTMRTEEVVGKDLEMGSSDEMSDDEQLQWPEDIDELDDPDEPIMEGSDDTLHPVTIHHNTHMPTNTDNCTSWSSTVNPVTII